MEKVLVTGCAGFIGSHFVELLLHRGYTVVGIDNFNDYYNPLVKEKNIAALVSNTRFVLYRADILDKEKILNVFEKERPTKIVHLAARAGVRNSFLYPQLYHDVNVIGTKNLLELAVRYKVTNLVFASSSSVYGTNTKIPFAEDDEVMNQISPYATTKLEGERLCKKFHVESGLNITCLRFFTVYGPRGRPDMAPYKFIQRVFEEKEIEVYGDGSTQRDYTYIDDIAAGIFSALTKNLPFEIINLGNNTPVRLDYFIKLIEEAVGKPAIKKFMEMQRGDVPITFADISKAQKLLEYNPRVSIEEGIARTAEWYKSMIQYKSL